MDGRRLPACRLSRKALLWGGADVLDYCPGNWRLLMMADIIRSGYVVCNLWSNL